MQDKAGNQMANKVINPGPRLHDILPEIGLNHILNFPTKWVGTVGLAVTKVPPALSCILA